MKNRLSHEEVKANLKRMGNSYLTSVEFELNNLRIIYDSCEDAVLYPYIPIRIVALMEGYFQELYSIIIDADAKYRNNFTKLVKDIKFDLQVIGSFEKNTITFGEYASMLLPCNSLEDIINNLKELLGVEELTDKFAGTTTLKDIKDIFFYRHIFCHEKAHGVILEKGQVLKMLDSASSFMEILQDIVHQVLYPVPLNTTVEMIDCVAKEFDDKEKELHELLNCIKKNVEEDIFGDEIGYLDIFEEYRRKRAEKVCKSYEGGSYYSIIYIITMKEITEELIFGLIKKYRPWLREFTLRT